MKNKKQLLEKELTDLWKSRCLETYEPFCEYCGQPMSAFHHFIPKSRSTLLRYDIKNAIPLCQKCHYKIHFSSKPSEVYEIVKSIRENRGKDWCKYIDEREGISISKTMLWLNEQKNKLTNI